MAKKEKVPIILGIFSGTSFYRVKEKTQSLEYPFGIGADDFDFDSEETGVMVEVADACKFATEINFVLDRIHLPLDSNLSVTCRELEHILQRSKLIKKTTFWLKGEIKSKNKVLRLIKMGQSGKFTFNNIDFDSIPEAE